MKRLAVGWLAALLLSSCAKFSTRVELCREVVLFADGAAPDPDSLRYEGCTDPWYEGRVLIPNGRGGWTPAR